MICKSSRSPLYHYLGVAKALSVFTDDAMPGRGQHFNQVSRKLLSGNSFSRNASMAVRAADAVQLTIDQATLACTHRIQPLDADFAYSLYQKHFRASGYLGVDWDATSQAKFNKSGKRDRVRNESGLQWQEEFVIGDIAKLSRIVTKIEVRHVNHTDFYDMCRIAFDFAERHKIPYAGWPPPARPPVNFTAVEIPLVFQSKL